MSFSREKVLAVAGALALAAAGCEKSSPRGEHEATADDESAPTRKKGTVEDEPETARGEEPTESAAPSPTTLDELPEGVNAVQNEMQLLNEAMQNTLTLIANDSLEGIPGEINKVHPARQLTAKALEKSVYEPPVNADNMKKFRELDSQFHEDLKGLLKASKKDDVEKAASQYGKLVESCATCHSTFRFE